MDSNRMLISFGVVVLVLVAGTGVFTAFPVLSDEPNRQMHVESYPVGPEKPTPVDSSNVADYTATYEERFSITTSLRATTTVSNPMNA